MLPGPLVLRDVEISFGLARASRRVLFRATAPRRPGRSPTIWVTRARTPRRPRAASWGRLDGCAAPERTWLRCPVPGAPLARPVVTWISSPSSPSRMPPGGRSASEKKQGGGPRLAGVRDGSAIFPAAERSSLVTWMAGPYALAVGAPRRARAGYAGVRREWFGDPGRSTTAAGRRHPPPRSVCLRTPRSRPPAFTLSSCVGQRVADGGAHRGQPPAPRLEWSRSSPHLASLAITGLAENRQYMPRVRPVLSATTFTPYFGYLA